MGETDSIGNELAQLTELMSAAKQLLADKGLPDADLPTLYKIAFTAVVEGRKQEYFSKQATQQRPRDDRPRGGYGQGNSQGGGYYNSDRYSGGRR